MEGSTERTRFHQVAEVSLFVATAAIGILWIIAAWASALDLIRLRTAMPFGTTVPSDLGSKWFYFARAFSDPSFLGCVLAFLAIHMLPGRRSG
jgi:hypothetical protein